jgi:hypothetical protein
MPVNRLTWVGAAAAAFGIALAGVFIGAGFLTIPVVGSLLLLRLQRHLALPLLAIVLGIGASWLAADWGNAVYAFAAIALPGLIIAETRRRGHGLPLALLLAAIAPIVAVIIFRELFITLFDLYVLTLEDLAASPTFSSFYSAQSSPMVVHYLIWWAEHALYYLPAAALAGLVSYYFFGALLGEYTVTRSGTFIKRVPPFTHWKAEEWLIVVLGIAAILILSGVHLLEIVGWNSLIFLIVVFSIFGISLLEYYMRQARLHSGVRALVYITLFILQVISGVLLPLAALFDARFDFRKIRAKRFG